MACLSAESAPIRTGLLKTFTFVMTTGGTYGSSRRASGKNVVIPSFPQKNSSPFRPVVATPPVVLLGSPSEAS